MRDGFLLSVLQCCRSIRRLGAHADLWHVPAVTGFRYILCVQPRSRESDCGGTDIVLETILAIGPGLDMPQAGKPQKL